MSNEIQDEGLKEEMKQEKKSDRDYEDLLNKEIAVYNFRGYTVLKFEKKTKSLDFGENASMCNFIPADYKLMSEFLDKCYRFCKGELLDIESVEVN